MIKTKQQLREDEKESDRQWNEQQEYQCKVMDDINYEITLEREAMKLKSNQELDDFVARRKQIVADNKSERDCDKAPMEEFLNKFGTTAR